MGTYCIDRELYSMFSGDPNGKEIRKKGVYVFTSCTAETNTTLEGNYSPIKIKEKVDNS